MFAENHLRRLRLERCISQEELAKRLPGERDRSQISLWERGVRPLPVESAQELAAILNCDWTELYGAPSVKLSAPEADLLAKFRQLSAPDQDRIIRIINALVDQP